MSQVKRMRLTSLARTMQLIQRPLKSNREYSYKSKKKSKKRKRRRKKRKRKRIKKWQPRLNSSRRNLKSKQRMTLKKLKN
jgi:hypothetical protein